MAFQQRDLSSLRPRCGCMMKGYPSQDAAERALARIQSLALRDAMPKKAVDCWQGQWHLVGNETVDTGPDKHTRALVVERDVWACAGCGDPIDLPKRYSLQHRFARKMGGSSNPAINSPANLITVCGSATTPDGCHLLCEQWDELMHRRGFWLKSGQDPTTTPVLHAAFGWVLLNVDGSVTPLPAGAA